MPKNQYCFAALILLLAAAPANAGKLDVLQGKFGFNWRTNPARVKCVKIETAILADFESDKYRCDLTVISNTSSGASARTCTEVKKDGKEYLIFDTLKACEGERKDQASNE
jgi:hypothetical protein